LSKISNYLMFRDERATGWKKNYASQKPRNKFTSPE
jgi:hypothetical protein